MKCGECIIWTFSAFYEQRYCNIARCRVRQNDNCHCEAERVAKLLEQLPEVKELLHSFAVDAENDGRYYNCDDECIFCGKCSCKEHSNKCPVKRAHDLLGGGK